jgi:hypothetical protein
MNELDLIRSFRADMPTPSAAATATAERAWRRAKQRGPRWTRWAPRWAPRALAGAVLVAAVSAAALILPSQQDSRLGTQPASAAETLRHAAAVHVGGMTRPLRPGEYWYVRRRTEWATVSESAGGWAVYRPQVREDWISLDGARHWRTHPVGPLRFPSSSDREHWEDAGRPIVSPRSEDHVAPAQHESFYLGDAALTYAQLIDLPRDPQALYRRMHDAAVECECGNGVDEETFVIAGDLLRDNPIPVDLRAAILRAAALIPDIELIAHQRDVAGRPGVGVAFDAPGPRRSVLIFDPQTYELLGENEGGGGSADIESAIVTSPNERP